MSNFEAGDTVVRLRGVNYGMRAGDTGVLKGCCGNGWWEIEGYDGSHSEDRLMLFTAANPDLITVSSLDYMTNKELSEEDKLIIKEALDDQAA